MKNPFFSASLWRAVLWVSFQLYVASSGRAETVTPLHPDEVIYQDALRDLGDGQLQNAIDKLTALTQRAPLHLGALLDLAIAHCQAGSKSEAERLFDRLAQLPNLPEPVTQLIAYQRLQCRQQATQWHGFIALGKGYADNFNQSPSVESFFIAPLGLTLQLAESARPRRDSATLIEAGVFQDAPNSQWFGGGFVQSSHYDHSNDYDSFLGQAHLGYRHMINQVRLEAQGIASYLTLDGKPYLTSWGTNFSAMLAPSAPASWQLGLLGGLTSLNYRQADAYRSHMIDVRGRLRWQSHASLNLQMDAGWSRDLAQGDRPGGSRSGPVVQIAGQWVLADDQSLEFSQRQSWLRDSKPYSPAFFADDRRDLHLSSWYLAWRRQLTRNFQLRVEARHTMSHDNIKIFDYDASSFNLMLEWRAN